MIGIENKIDWRIWSREAFQEAEELDIPVLLFLEQFWSGLCRLIYITSWNDEATASAVNKDFIPICVDVTRRPDIERKFRTSDLPAVSLLTSDLRPIATTTFLPPDLLLDALASVKNLWDTERLQITARAEEADSTRQLLHSMRIDPTRRPSPWMTSKILANIQSFADADFGGFGNTPKVPHFDVLSLLMIIYARTRDESFKKSITDALDQMLESTMNDWEDGGFFRCCDSADWTSPRFEKLLVDQARHVDLYTRAGELFGDTEYLEAVEGILEYCDRILFNPALGVFSNSQAADAVYYSLTRDERDRYSLPPVDMTVFTDSNSTMIRALLAVEKRRPDNGFAERALRIFAKIEELCAPSGSLVFHYYDREPQIQGLLLDQIEVGLTLLAIEEYIKDGAYLARAIDLATLIHEHFYDSRQAGYFDTIESSELSWLSVREKSFEDNARLASFFGKIARMSSESVWNERAQTALAGFSGVWEKLGLASATYGLALLDIFSE